MSWDVIIAKTADPNFVKPSEDAGLLPLGNLNEVKVKLSAFDPKIEWASATQGHTIVGKISLEILLLGKTPERGAPRTTATSLAGSDDVWSIGISARGEGDPVALVTMLAKTNSWSVADSQDGGWMDLNAPSLKSWKAFSEYRNEVFGGKQGGDSSGGSVGMNLLISVAVFVVLVLLVRLFPK
jgi:hypothetical protein